jgi:hypothetical protein
VRGHVPRATEKPLTLTLSPRAGRGDWIWPAILFLVILNLALPARASTLRVFGSAGAESQMTPANEHSPLNPRNIANIPSQTNVADFNVFAEATADDRAWKLRVKVRGDASDRADERLSLGEAFVQIRATSWLDLGAGRVIEKWGTGYGWSPTAFVGPSKNPTDPNDRRSQYEGVDMLRADVFVKETSVSLYALRRGAYAARAYRLVGGTDVSLAFRRDRDNTRTGVSLSRVFGEALEVHAEVARSNTATQAVAGAQYTIGATNLVAEIYHGTDGLTRGGWDRFRELVDAGDLRRANGDYALLRMARTYTFLRVYRDVARWKSDGELIAITNVRDGSTLVRATVSRRLLPNLSAYAIATEFLGAEGSEMAYIQVARVVALGVRVHF